MSLINEQIAKLPKWAQEHIRSLQYQRDAAVTTLNEFQDSQTPSDIWIEQHPCTGEKTGPIEKRLYLQAHSVTFKLGDEEVTVGFSYDRPAIKISTGWKSCTFRAHASNVIELIEEKR